MSIAASIPMPSPQLRKEFQEDCEIVRNSLETAMLHLKAERAENSAKATMKRTRLARLDVGRALQRMHSTASWRGNFSSWGQLCRHLKVIREDSYDLMNAAGVVDSLAPAQLAAFPNGLSRRDLKTLAIADQDLREEAAHLAAETGDTQNALAALRASLSSAPPVPLNEAEAQPKPRTKGSAWIKGQLVAVGRWFDGQGLGEAAAPHLAALREIAGA